MKACPSFEGYSIDDDLQVVSHRNRYPLRGGGSEMYIDSQRNKILIQTKHNKGYLQVSISFEGKIRPIGVHVLIADAYHGPKPEGMEVRHLDDDPTNNHPTNLAYGNKKDNAADRQRNGGYTAGSDHHNAKLTAAQAEELKKGRKEGAKVKELAAAFGISTSTVESIIYNKSYKNVH